MRAWFLRAWVLLPAASVSIALAAPAPGVAPTAPDRDAQRQEVVKQALEKSRREREMLAKIPRRVFLMGYTPGGSYLATLGTGGGINGGGRLYETNIGRMRASISNFRGPEPVALAFSTDGSRVAVAYRDAPADLCELVLADPVIHVKASLQGPSRGLTALLFSPDGTTLAAASAYDGRVGLYDPENGALRQTLVGHEAPVMALAFSPDGKTLVTGSVDGRARLWSVPERTSEASTGGGSGVRRAPPTPPIGQARAVLEPLGGRVYAIAFSPDGRTLATGYGAANVAGETVSPIAGGATLWDVRNNRVRGRLIGHRGAVVSLAFSPDGALIATGSDDGTARLWNVTLARHRATLSGHARGAQVAFSPDGKTLATFDGGLRWETPDTWLQQTGVLRLWDVASAQLRAALEKPSEAFTFSPGGGTVATSDADGELRLWDVHDGRLVKWLRPLDERPKLQTPQTAPAPGR